MYFVAFIFFEMWLAYLVLQQDLAFDNTEPVIDSNAVLLNLITVSKVLYLVL
jgi:hypothetical protein